MNLHLRSWAGPHFFGAKQPPIPPPTTITPCHAIGGTFKLTSTTYIFIFRFAGSQPPKGYTDLVSVKSKNNVKLRTCMYMHFAKSPREKEKVKKSKKKKKPCISPPQLRLSQLQGKIKKNPTECSLFELVVSPPLSPHDSFLCFGRYKEEI